MEQIRQKQTMGNDFWAELGKGLLTAALTAALTSAALLGVFLLGVYFAGLN